MNDWYKPLDPRQYYYATYNIARANMNQSADRNFVFAEERALFAKASPAAIKNICQGLLPLRHVHWGGNMNMLEICQSCYGAAIGNPTMFSATDHLGMAQYISRIGLLIDNQSGSSLHDAKEIWLNDPAWQEIRRLVEDSFVVRDWFELFVIQTLGINGVILPLVYKNAEAAWQDAGLTLALLTETMSDWLTEEARWSDAVIKMVAAESGDNKIFISNWAKHWINRAAEAAKPLSALLLKDDGAAAQTAGTLALKRAAGLGLAV
jgi:phenol hydroxylase P1 protein